MTVRISTRFGYLQRARWGALAMLLAGLTGASSTWAQVAERQPPMGQSSPAPATAVRAYPVPLERLESTFTQLQEQYAGNPEVRIAVDRRSQQLLVVAPLNVQEAIATAVSGNSGASANTAPATATMPLRKTTAIEFASALQSIVPGRTAGPQASNQIKVPLADGRSATLTLLSEKRSVQIDAPADALPILRRLVQTLDAPRSAAEVANVAPLHRADPATVTKALKMAGVDPPSVAHTRRHIGQFVTMLFQPEPGQNDNQPPQPGRQPNGQPMPDGQMPNGQEPPEEELDDPFGKIGDVTIEFVEGLDIIVVRGKKRDVEQVMRLIEEIERQSIETRPDIEVYHLKYVNDLAMAELINQIYAQVFGARQGTVSITPLVKPNALLLIGRRENIQSVIELITRLDQPVAPETQFHVFSLKHISSADAERTVRGVFEQAAGGAAPTNQAETTTAGLAPRLLVFSEPRTNSLLVRASPRDLTEVARLIQSIDVVESAAKNEVRIFRLQNTLAEELVPVLQNAISGEGGTTPGAGGIGGVQQNQPAAGSSNTAVTKPTTSLQFLRIDKQGAQLLESGILADLTITADPRGNAVIVTGPSRSMPLIEALIQQLDEMPALEAQIKVFTIINGDATQLADMLRQLFGQPTGQGGQGAFGALQTATGSGDNSLVPLRFSVDVRTNSIIASGSAGDLAVVYKILVRLDEGDIRQRVTTVYRLRNAPALEVGQALQQLLTSQRQVNQLAPNLTSAFQQIEQEVIVVPEIVSNSLIVSATPRFFEDIRRVVEELDRRPPMVAIQVLLAEVSLNDIDQFGIELGLQDSLLFDRGIGAIGFPFNQAGIGNNNTPASLATRGNVAGQALGNFGVGRTDPALGYGGLVLSASSESVSVLIRALQQSQRLQILSRPQVQTLDNQPAYVQVGAQVPFITSSQLTTFGTTNSVSFQNVGIILGVTPRTSPDGMIVMEVDATKSQLGPEAEGIPISINANGDVIRSPQINITRAQTTVSARSGQTVILGGLITRDQSELTRRVPYLADVPVLGRLFRFDSVTLDRRELLIILTPYIMSTDEQIAWLNQRESERMNWCLADVVAVHGESPMGSSGKYDGTAAPTEYPASESAWPPVQPLVPRPPVELNPDNPMSPATPTGPQGPVTPVPVPVPAVPTLPVPVPQFPQLTPPGLQDIRNAKQEPISRPVVPARPIPAPMQPTQLQPGQIRPVQMQPAQVDPAAAQPGLPPAAPQQAGYVAPAAYYPNMPVQGGYRQ